MAQSLKIYMDPVQLSVGDHTLPAVMIAKKLAMAMCRALLVKSPAQSAAIIPSAASYVTSHAHRVPKIAPGLAHIVANANYHVLCHVTYYHVQSVAQRCWLVGIDVCPFVERSVQIQLTVRSVPQQPSRRWLLTLFYHLRLRRLILMKILALCLPVDTF